MSEKNPGSNKAILCKKEGIVSEKVDELAEKLRTESHKLVSIDGMDEDDFYESIFRGAIEKLRGQYSARSSKKQEFINQVLNQLEEKGHILSYESIAGDGRTDYLIDMPDGKKVALEAKGCLDGNNTNIFKRPEDVDEFVIWSLCTNPTSDPRHNVWSGLHSRLGVEMCATKVHVDGLIVWDWLCNSPYRQCPKQFNENIIGSHKLPPPCIYLFPQRVPSLPDDPMPPPASLDDVSILKAFAECFGADDSSQYQFHLELKEIDGVLKRQTTIKNSGQTIRSSNFDKISR